jgi:hypothetical protein
MKTLITPTLALTFALTTTSAWAHGNLAKQANAAVTSAVTTLEQTHRAELRDFKSVTAEVIGHETFAVKVVFSNQTEVSYVCAEDESVEPAIWNCIQK